MWSGAMRALRKFAKLGRSERALLVRGLLWVVGARVGLAVTPFPRLQRLLDRASARYPIRTPCDAERVRWAVTAAACRVPGAHCLAWALAFRGLLAQAGIQSELRMGLAKSDDGRIRGHAWIDCAGTSFSWGDDVSDYTELPLPKGGDSTSASDDERGPRKTA